MRAQKQGDLDGLCGLYAIVNAIELTGVVGPKSVFHRRLFKRMLEGLPERELHRAMTHGLSHHQLIKVGSHAFKSLRRRYGVGFQIEGAVAEWSPDDFAGYLAYLDRLSKQPRTAVIINVVMPRVDHWSVLKGIGLASIELRDSGRLRFLKRDRFAFRGSSYRIEAICTLVVRRVGGPPTLRAITLI